MRTLIMLLVLSGTCIAGETVRFFESWEPRPAVRELWLPMRESWWDTNRGFEGPRVDTHFKAFARTHAPEVTSHRVD
jgi:hypothetical protein